jgi:DNA-binding NtrC family response regulator
MGAHMEPASCNGMPNDVLIVEDDAIIALDFEDTILGFGVKTVRTAANVAKALDLIADRHRISRCSISDSSAKRALRSPNGWMR